MQQLAEKTETSGAGAPPSSVAVALEPAPPHFCPYLKVECTQRCDPKIGPGKTHCVAWVLNQRAEGEVARAKRETK